MNSVKHNRTVELNRLYICNLNSQSCNSSPSSILPTDDIQTHSTCPYVHALQFSITSLIVCARRLTCLGESDNESSKYKEIEAGTYIRIR